MRVERGAGWWCAVGVVLVACVPAGARAEGLFGSAQLQFQRIEDFTYIRREDGTLEQRPFLREVWLQSYEMNHRAYPRQNVLMQSTLRFNQIAYSHSSDLERAPTGSFRVLHPYANFYASSQPTMTRVALIPPGATAFDSLNASTVTTRRNETQLIGHVAPPRWPQLDVSWTRRSRQAVATAPGEESRQRSARLGIDRERWNSYFAWTDQRFERRVSAAVPLDQRVLRSGGSLRLPITPAAGLNLQYDFTGTRSGFQGSRKTDTRSHNADATGEWRHSPRWVTSLASSYRRTVSTQLRSGAQNDFESGLLTSWQPTTSTRLTTGGGARTVRLLEGTRTLGYATAVAGADGRMRQGWRVAGSASNTVNWDPERGTFAVQTAGGSSRMEFTRRVQFDADLQLTANGDTAAVSQRYTNSWGTRLFIQPLRSFSLSGTWRSYRIGRSWLKPLGVTRARGVDLMWKPLLGVDLTASYNTTGLLPNDSPRLVTRSAAARLSPSAAVQLTGTWSRSSQERSSTAGTPFSGREFVSGRAQVAFTRRVAASGGLTVANPGTERSSREYDAVLTWSFGR